jgi:membrane protein implicated in regulation of membrane protease activity
MFDNVTREELRLVYMSIAIIALSIIAIILLAYGVNGIIFYVVAIIAIALGFYMARSISSQRPETQQGSRSRERR